MAPTYSKHRQKTMCTSIAVYCFFACKIGDFGKKTGDCVFTKKFQLCM